MVSIIKSCSPSSRPSFLRFTTRCCNWDSLREYNSGHFSRIFSTLLGFKPRLKRTVNTGMSCLQRFLLAASYTNWAWLSEKPISAKDCMVSSVLPWGTVWAGVDKGGTSCDEQNGRWRRNNGALASSFTGTHFGKQVLHVHRRIWPKIQWHMMMAQNSYTDIKLFY